MKRQIITIIIALALTITAQGQTETIDTAQFVAVYDYECRTLNDEGQDITDRMQLAVQVGRTVVKSMPLSSHHPCRQAQRRLCRRWCRPR